MRPLLAKPWHVIISCLLVGVLMVAVAHWLRQRSEFFSDVLMNLGIGLTGAIITFLLLNWYLPRLLDSNGKVTHQFLYAEYARNIQRSRKRVWILSTFIYPLTSKPEHAADKVKIVNALRTCPSANHDVDCKILLLRPDSEAAMQRLEELKELNEDPIMRIKENLAELYSLMNVDPYYAALKSIHVKLYDRPPPLSIFLWDDSASMSFYPRDKEISKTTRFEFSVPSPLGTFMSHTFDDVWNDPKSVSLEQYMRIPLRVGDKAVLELDYIEIDPTSLIVFARSEHFDMIPHNAFDAHVRIGGVFRAARVTPETVLSTDLVKAKTLKFGRVSHVAQYRVVLRCEELPDNHSEAIMASPV